MTALKAVTADPEKPSSSIVYVDPVMAARWMERNVKNRPLKKAKVAQFARDMSNGRWQITGEAIKFAQDGALLDGQNRLTAVVQSGATVPMFVVRGLAAEAQEVMDSGTPRSAADALGLREWANAKDIAPTVSALAAWESGFFAHSMHQSNPKFTNSEVIELSDNTPDIAEFVSFVKPVQRELPLPIGALGACAYRFGRIDADDMADFYERIRNLHTSGKGDPIATLLKRVADERLVRRRLWVSTGIYFQVRAWNAYRAGEPLSKFQIGSEKRGWAQIPEPR